jgi:hypothetical protein
MSTKETPTVNSVGHVEQGIVFEIDRSTASRLVDEWEMFEDEEDAVEAVVEYGVAELDSIREMMDEADEDARPPSWRSSA